MFNEPRKQLIRFKPNKDGTKTIQKGRKLKLFYRLILPKEKIDKFQVKDNSSSATHMLKYFLYKILCFNNQLFIVLCVKISGNKLKLIKLYKNQNYRVDHVT